MIKLGLRILHIKMVTHTKFQLVFMSLRNNFGTPHFYDQIWFFFVDFFHFDFFSKTFFFLVISSLSTLPWPLSSFLDNTSWSDGHYSGFFIGWYTFYAIYSFLVFLHFCPFMFWTDSHLALFVPEGGQGPSRSSGGLHSVFGALQW